MDLSNVFRIVNLGVAVFMVLGGIAQFFHPSISRIIIGIYAILFGVGTGFLEFQIPPVISKYASFMFSFIGRGIFYVFIGTVIVGSQWYRIVDGVIIGFIGLAYAVLEFIPSIEPPANMRDADPNWGAEQI